MKPIYLLVLFFITVIGLLYLLFKHTRNIQCKLLKLTKKNKKQSVERFALTVGAAQGASIHIYKNGIQYTEEINTNQCGSGYKELTQAECSQYNSNTEIMSSSAHHLYPKGCVKMIDIRGGDDYYYNPSQGNANSDSDIYKICIKANTCTCTNGGAAIGSSCTRNGANICARCNNGYTKSGNSCVANICTCPNGVAATGSSCTSNGASKCARCNDGYRLLSNNTCVQNTCECSSGQSNKQETGAQCPIHQIEDCKECGGNVDKFILNKSTGYKKDDYVYFEENIYRAIKDNSGNFTPTGTTNPINKNRIQLKNGSIPSSSPNILTSAANHNLKNDDIVMFTNVGSLSGGVAINTNYYVKTIGNPNKFKLNPNIGGSSSVVSIGGSTTYSTNLVFRNDLVWEYIGKNKYKKDDYTISERTSIIINKDDQAIVTDIQKYRENIANNNKDFSDYYYNNSLTKQQKKIIENDKQKWVKVFNLNEKHKSDPGYYFGDKYILTFDNALASVGNIIVSSAKKGLLEKNIDTATKKIWTVSPLQGEFVINDMVVSSSSSKVTNVFKFKGINKCPAGKHSASAGSKTCTNCPSGEYSASVGSSTCNECPINSYSPAGSTSCASCKSNQFSIAKQSECTLCSIDPLCTYLSWWTT